MSRTIYSNKSINWIALAVIVFFLGLGVEAVATQWKEARVQVAQERTKQERLKWKRDSLQASGVHSN